MKRLLSFFVLLLSITTLVQAQVITVDPQFPTADQSVTIEFDATQGDGGLEDYTGDIYAHTGVISSQSTSSSDWKYVIADWDENIPKAKLERDNNNPNLYTLEITSSIREFYGVPEGETIEQMAFVFRNNDSSLEGKADGGADIFADVYQSTFNIKFTEPARDPIFREVSGSLSIQGVASSQTGGTIDLSLLIDGTQVASVTNDTLEYVYQAQTEGEIEIALAGTDGSEQDTVYKNLHVYPQQSDQDRPTGLKDGITYVDNNTVRLSLFAPDKEFAYLIGDFSNWEVQSQYLMNKDQVNADSSYFWIELDGLTPGQEYGFQYFVDGEIKVAEPYSEKILDPFNDQYIQESTYPNLKTYPQETEEAVGVLQPGKSEYNWQHQNYNRPEKENLVIYELLIRDFVENHDYKTLTDTLDYLDRLGVNAVELMPVMEFEGNISWGYNPSFLFATDKYYGPADNLKKFIDETHSRDMAVILDIVLNHVYGQSPLVRLWNEGNYGAPTSQNPYLNKSSPNQTYSWGYDFNHESQATKYYVDRVTRYWLEEFNADGYRFDFTKGFTQTPGDGWQRDDDRIRLLKRMADQQWAVDDSSYVILEHLTENSEEQELADHGMLLWGNMNHPYNEATMGYHENEKSNFSGISYTNRGWNNPYLVGYMESHDEERLMYKNLQYGNSNNSGNYDITERETALVRNKMAAAFFYTVPGPKMLWQFGELGYEKSINLCEDGSVSDDCRVSPKPILWEYYNNEPRRKLYNTYKALIRLRNSHPTFTSGETEVSIDVENAGKRITLSHPDMEVSIIGNFGVTEMNKQPAFAQSGTWYNFFSGDTLNVSNPDTTISLKPGEFHIYTTQKFEQPEGDPVSGGIDEPDENLPVSEIKLEPNYPNPFNPGTTIPYALPEGVETATFTVYDILGREVKRRQISSDQPSIQFNASDLPSGMYIYRIEAGSSAKSRKMLLIK